MVCYDPGEVNDKMRVLVVLPTYNEALNIEWIIKSLIELPLGADVLVVDDNSPDGTADLAERVGPAGRVRVERRPGKLGLGSAQRAGMAAGIKGGYERIVIMDADGSHDPGTVPALVAATANADLSIGSRYVAGGRVENWAWYRRFLSWGANTMARLVLGRDVHDWTSSFRCCRVEMLKNIPLDRFRSEGFAAVEEILFQVRFRGYRVVEVPITFVERRAGRSKIDRSEVMSAVWRLLVMGLIRAAGKRPRHD
ncbi:MAG TPA: polyprenol monophosphomannose synthase [bacterium]|nr:polyprenol monophosphomannose synthase [bacterium]